jgi:type IV pilus assembly protein PilV
MTRLPTLPSGHAGATLIEILIAALILAVGMLGVGAMQAAALRNSQSSLERSQAVLETYAILDTMRANLIAARTGDYNMPLTCDPLAGGRRAELERAAWHRGVKDRLGEDACARIACTDNVCTVQLVWDDSRGTAGATEQEITTVSQL